MEREGRTESFKAQAIEIASLAVQAILYEASCHPSPGLVSAISTGAHSDMDYFTFLDSASALISPLIQCAQAGLSPESPKEIFQKIRSIGRLGEQRMFAKTRGVNTHKGTIFLLGICCAAAGKALYSGAGFASLRSIIQAMTEGLVEGELSARNQELASTDPTTLTHGERLYLTHKVEGVRGEVQRGLPIVFDIALNVYQENRDLSLNSRLIQTLVAIMQFCEDTNILHRHSMETLREVQARAVRIIALGGMKTPAGSKAIDDLDKDFRQRRISPGGSADLLGVTVFVALLEDLFNGR
ncbi:triphosphoribosyl-dephospho-CoA synthase CitG [Desulfosporosinus meridiei]|uniref:Probable 2-(5''-triphosphoribosyl)-3'-dephosphocoenzyme-A synthase n=1 Tax=Desulfosporosinus meridiei (strain ATCC BAA-275 / DSM 13257 / KCTC 12902 / NCIMB 13706 / S10) TaxID=768704 RepID=J7J539_DESMD|nr:triphosphoribosyl-dephospho-CoA synthase CitG [Desulfosporosinus meridiei]AFQ46071.1 triphosphoribosyl-dephospho-CoA synthase CitG [Desulfosporosinus meridiei DSM 13257]